MTPLPTLVAPLCVLSLRMLAPSAATSVIGLETKAAGESRELQKDDETYSYHCLDSEGVKHRVIVEEHEEGGVPLPLALAGCASIKAYWKNRVKARDLVGQDGGAGRSLQIDPGVFHKTAIRLQGKERKDVAFVNKGATIIWEAEADDFRTRFLQSRRLQCNPGVWYGGLRSTTEVDVDGNPIWGPEGNDFIIWEAEGDDFLVRPPSPTDEKCGAKSKGIWGEESEDFVYSKTAIWEDEAEDFLYEKNFELVASLGANYGKSELQMIWEEEPGDFILQKA